MDMGFSLANQRAKGYRFKALEARLSAPLLGILNVKDNFQFERSQNGGES
jgi:hypothetical protein